MESRIISDAELLQNGASIENGKMRITDEQYRDFSFPTAAGEVAGRLVLHSVLGEKSSQSLESVTERAQRHAGVVEELKTVTEPYALLFDSLMPTTKSRGIIDKLNKSKDMDEHRTTRQFKHTAAQYKIGGEYIAGQTMNLPKKVSMDIKNIGEWMKRKPAVELDLEFEGTNISAIDLRMNCWEENVASSEELMPNNSGFLEAFLVQSGMFMYGQKHAEVKIAIQNEAISLQVFTVRGRKNPYVYTYSPEKDSLTVGVHGAGERTVPQVMSRQQFVGIVSDIMALLPVREDI